MQNNSYRPNDSSSNNEAIVDKIHGVVASMRRERDDLHRKHQLSLERLRLTKEEKDSLEKTVQTLREKVGKLTAQASGQAQKELEELQASVEKLAKEVKFQHQELVRKQDLLAQQRQDFAQAEEARQLALRNGREAIRKLQNTQPPAYQLDSKTALDLLKLEMNGDQRLWALWPGILEEHAAELNTKAAMLQTENAALERILEGYYKKYGLKSEGKGDAMMEG